MRRGARSLGVLRRSLAVALGLFGCRTTVLEPPTRAPAEPPRSAPARLDVTLDDSEPLIIEDDAQRHAPPPEMLRRRIYTIERRFHRWYPPAPPVKKRPVLFAPYVPRAHPTDLVPLRGQPAPVPGERFVVFDETGRLAVVEAIGKTCPPGVDGCIVCAEGDPERRHWARVIDGSMKDREGALALGPFAADEPLPEPRSFYADPLVRGRWTLTDTIDLDGDGAFDRVFARRECHPRRRCDHREIWRRHDGRWYAEPEPPAPSPAPLHLLTPLSLGNAHIVTHFGSERSLGGPGRAVVTPSVVDDTAPVDGDYWILGSRGVVGRLRFPADHAQGWCLFHGPPCYEAERVQLRLPKRGSPIVVAGPIPASIDVRAVELPKVPRHNTLWDPNRAALELAVDLTDGTRWTVASRPCIEETPEHLYHGTCFETRIERPGLPPHRRLVGSFTMLHEPIVTPICHD
jgi:hypothetical protein